jgi:very-short-patch-repair endonuclease
MGSRYLKEQVGFARQLRRNMTHAEVPLRRGLRNSGLDGLKFRRQVPIGAYVVDFLCVRQRLIVELDGPPHLTETQRGHDSVRDAWLCQQGYKILRLTNDLVIGGGDIALDRIREAVRS